MVDADATSEDTLKNTYSISWFSDYCDHIYTSVNNVSFEEVKLVSKYVLHYFASIVSSFDEFQLLILKIFSILLLINAILIVVLWNIYKDRIYDRFIRPASSNLIEELRKSVSQLKLTKRHSPRI